MSRQGKGLEGSVPSLILGCGNGWGHAGLLQGQPSLSPGLVCSSWAQLHVLEPVTLVLAVTAIPLSQLPAGAAGLCQPRGLNCAVATARVLLGQRQREKEGECGGAQPCGTGMGWGFPCFLVAAGVWPSIPSPSCLCRSAAAAALQSHVLGSWAAVLGPPGEWGSPVHPSTGTGSCQGCSVPQRAASLLPHRTPQPFSGDFTTSTSVSSSLRPTGAGGGVLFLAPSAHISCP